MEDQPSGPFLFRAEELSATVLVANRRFEVAVGTTICELKAVGMIV